MGRHAKLGRSAGSSRRTAMGEYVPPPGVRPLSSLTHPLPSPAHYRPKTAATLPRSPAYSLRSRPCPLKSEPTPSPSKYNTSKNALWLKGVVTMKKKDVTWPYDTRKDAHMTDGPGAGNYLRSRGDTGSGIARAVSARHREGIHAGHPNLLIQPVDTHGFSTPGPELWRSSERGPQHYIANTLKKKEVDSLGPGPAGYTLPILTPPTPLIGEKPLNTHRDPQYPAPNEYDIPDLIGIGVARSFGVKSNTKAGMQSPAPNTYTPRSTQTRASHSMTYKPFPTPLEKRPGPAEYSLTYADHPHEPEYSCKRRCLPVFPDVLNYPEHATLTTPGIGAYEYDREFQDNTNPAYSIKLPLPLKPNSNPAPNQYRAEHGVQSNHRTGPQYSMGLKPDPQRGRDGGASGGPGPAAYSLRPASAPSAPITPRRTTKLVSLAPAPNNYEIERGRTNKGKFMGPAASMKGRSTPLQYSGFPSSHMARLASLAG